MVFINYYIKIEQISEHNWNPVQAFLDFRDFRSNAVYNSILFSSPLILLSNLDLRGFASAGFFCVPTLTS